MKEWEDVSIISHLKHLSGEIGPRPRGSAANHKAAAYISSVFESVGLSVEEQRIELPTWEHQLTELKLGGNSLQAEANPFSPPCDVTASTTSVGTIHELEEADVRDRVCVMYGDLTKNPLSPKSWMFKGENDEKIVRLLEEKRPAAVIAVQTKLGFLDRLIEDWELEIPSATVPYEAGLALLLNPAAKVHLRIVAKKTPGISSNVVGRKRQNGEASIVFCAHYDTKFDTPGALDNGGGVAVLLTLAEALTQKDLNHDLEFVAFTGEEYLPLGDDEYVRRRGDGFNSMVAAINFDGVGQYLGSTSIAIFSSSTEFQGEVQQVVSKHPGIVWVDPWPESNHSTFAWRGVPSVAFSSMGGVSLEHLRMDTVDWMNPQKLIDVANVAVEIIDLLQNRSPHWTRKD